MDYVGEYMRSKEDSYEIIVLSSKLFGAFCCLGIGYHLGQWLFRVVLG